MVDGFLKIRKQKLNRHAPTLWQGKMFPFCASPSLSYQVNALPAKEIYSLHIDRNMQIFTTGFQGRQLEWSNPDLKNLIMIRLQIHVFPFPSKKERIHLRFLESCAWKQLAVSVLHHLPSQTSPNPGEGSIAQPQDVPQQRSPAQGCSSLSSLLQGSGGRSIRDATRWHFLEKLGSIKVNTAILGGQLWKAPQEALCLLFILQTVHLWISYTEAMTWTPQSRTLMIWLELMVKLTSSMVLTWTLWSS